MLPYAGYVDPESTLAIGVHHDGHLEATERTFCSLYHTFMFGFHPFAQHPSIWNCIIYWYLEPAALCAKSSHTYTAGVIK